LTGKTEGIIQIVGNAEIAETEATEVIEVTAENDVIEKIERRKAIQ
jgi:hypothetical protein